MKKLLLAVLFLVLFTRRSDATLYINEFNSGSNSDWIEIYNSDSSSVDLSEYILRDSTDTNKLELTGTVNGNGFLSFDWNSKLNNEEDSIRLLLKSDESSVDIVSYGNSGAISAPSGIQTGGRKPDGSGTWVIFESGTRNLSNNASQVVPTPTPSPTNSPTNTPTPTPTNSPTNTPTPSPTKTPTPTPSKGPSPTLVSKPSPTPQVLAANTSNQAPQQGATSDSNVDLGSNLSDLEKPKEQGYNWWKLFIVMGSVIITGAVGVFLYNNHIKERSEELGQSM